MSVNVFSALVTISTHVIWFILRLVLFNVHICFIPCYCVLFCCFLLHFGGYVRLNIHCLSACGQALRGHPITTNHFYAFLKFREDSIVAAEQCGGLPDQSQKFKTWALEGHPITVHHSYALHKHAVFVSSIIYTPIHAQILFIQT